MHIVNTEMGERHKSEIKKMINNSDPPKSSPVIDNLDQDMFHYKTLK